MHCCNTRLTPPDRNATIKRAAKFFVETQAMPMRSSLFQATYLQLQIDMLTSQQGHKRDLLTLLLTQSHLRSILDGPVNARLLLAKQLPQHWTEKRTLNTNSGLLTLPATILYPKHYSRLNAKSLEFARFVLLIFISLTFTRDGHLVSRFLQSIGAC